MLRLFNWLVSIAECLHGESVKFGSLIRQLASDLGEVFDLELDHYLLQYQVMQQHPDIYQTMSFASRMRWWVSSPLCSIGHSSTREALP